MTPPMTTPPSTLSYAHPGGYPRINIPRLTMLYAAGIALASILGALAYLFPFNPAPGDASLLILLTFAAIFSIAGPLSFAFTLLFFRRRPKARAQPALAFLLGLPLGIIPALSFVISDGTVGFVLPSFFEVAFPITLLSYSPLVAIFLTLFKTPILLQAPNSDAVTPAHTSPPKNIFPLTP